MQPAQSQSRPAARVIYHDNCLDGIVAAAAAGQFLEQSLGITPKYTAASYTDKFDPAKYTAETVYIVDFSFPIDQMKKICDGSGKVSLIDHHDTAAKFLAIRDGDAWTKAPGLPSNLDIVFDLTRSGAKLTWETLNPGKPIPDLVTYANDYDLWLKAYPASAHLAAARDINRWNIAKVIEMLGDSEAVRLEARAGEPYVKFMSRQTAEVARHATPAELPDCDGNVISGYLVDCPAFLANDVAELIRNEHPGEKGFIALVTQRHVNDTPVVKLSLRRLDNETDVGKIAKHFGGGGHPYAASGNMTWSQLAEVLDQRPTPAPTI